MNYKQTTLTGESWTRCSSVSITNPLPGTGERHIFTGAEQGPVACFQEEKVLSIDGVQSTVNAGSCCKVFDAAATIPMLDPTTGTATGTTVTHAELYAILFSLYMQTAVERDGALG
jgi:hypothetical protein